MAGFVFTQQMDDISNKLWAVTSAVGAVLCFLVLIVIFVLGMHRSSKRHLDRVSFRLLRSALIANMLFGIASAVGGSLTAPGFLCGFSIFILQLTLEWSSFVLFAIALNLQLVVVHHISGQMMERYYIIGATVLALAITIPPYAAKQYGWDPLVRDCWYTNDNQVQRLWWQIGTQLLWTGLTVLGEVCTSVTVIVYMVKHRRKAAHSSLQSSSGPSLARSRGGSVSTTQGRQLVDIANAYRGVILRIGLYPMASCIINLTSMMCVAHATSTGGVKSREDYNILLLSDFLYGGRAIVYALLAASDPALVRASRAFHSHIFGSCTNNQEKPSGNFGSKFAQSSAARPLDTMVVEIELSTVYSSPGEKTTQPVSSLASLPERPGADGREEVERGSIMDQKASSLPTSEGTPFQGFVSLASPEEDTQQPQSVEIEHQEAKDAFHKHI